MKIDPKHLIAIETIRLEGSLTRAASALGTSQPALSRMVSDLEIRIAAPLFDRRYRPWRLTRLGDGFARQGATVLRAQTRAAQEFEQFTAGGRDTLRLIGPPFFTDGAITTWLTRFREDNRDVSFEISYGYGETLLNTVSDGGADVAIYPVALGEMPQELVFTPLLEARNVIACRMGHPILKLSYPRPLALLGYGWVSPPPGSPLAADMAAILEDLDMHEADIVMSGSSLAGVLNFVARSDCLTVLPEATVDSMGLAFELRSIPIATRTPRRPIGLLSRPDAELSHTARSFLRFMETGFRSVRAGLAVAPSGQVATEG